MGDLHAPVLGVDRPELGHRHGWCCTCCSATNRCSTCRHTSSFIRWSSCSTRCSAWSAGWFRSAFVKLLLWQRKRFLAMPDPHAVAFSPSWAAWWWASSDGSSRTCWASATTTSARRSTANWLLRTMALLVVLKLVATADLLRFRQRGRHLRSEPVHRRDDGRRGRGRGALFSARLHRQRRRVRAGRDGDRVRRDRPRAADLGDHDLRDHPRLLDHRAADDRQPDQLFHLQPAPAGADLRSPAAPGRDPPSAGASQP